MEVSLLFCCFYPVSVAADKHTHTFSDEDPSDVSSPSLPSSQGFLLLGFFFLLLLAIAAPRLSASGILPSAAGNRSTVYMLNRSKVGKAHYKTLYIQLSKPSSSSSGGVEGRGLFMSPSSRSRGSFLFTWKTQRSNFKRPI